MWLLALVAFSAPQRDMSGLNDRPAFHGVDALSPVDGSVVRLFPEVRREGLRRINPGGGVKPPLASNGRARPRLGRAALSSPSTGGARGSRSASCRSS